MICDFQRKFGDEIAMNGDTQCCHLQDTYITMAKRLREAEHQIISLTEGLLIKIMYPWGRRIDAT